MYQCIKQNDSNKGSYAPWLFTHITDQKKDRILDYQDYLIQWLPNVKTNGIIRSMIRSVAQYNQSPSNFESERMDLCFHYLLKIEYEIAVKANAMQVLHLYCKKYPKLISELQSGHEGGMDLYSSGLKARSRNILKSFHKILEKDS